jgi:integral membrane protein
VPDFADDTTTELERKARALSVVALVETVSYLTLLYFWLSGNDAGTAITGSLHGMIWLAFCAMAIMIAPAMSWSWWYVALVIVTGPIGALAVWERIRRHGVPDQYASKT